MDRVVHIWEAAARQQSRVRGVYQHLAAQPGYAWRAAVVTFLLILTVPVILFILAALLIAMVVFSALGLAGAIVQRLRGALPRRDGRENVRVIVRNSDVT